MANIESEHEAKRAIEIGADGIGLFRTEYLFLNSKVLPTEDEQYEAYKNTVETMNGLPVIIRTFDLGGDKMSNIPELGMIMESNPFLGYRAIRYCLDNIDFFTTQLRAILRASTHGDIRIMYPMISGRLNWNRLTNILKLPKTSSEAKAFLLMKTCRRAR